ncbi:MAG: elongation factor P [Chloroflexi bacterium]|nr:elongation factor P [Chloroflexota bacterium]
MISSNDFRNGNSIELDGDIFTVTDFQHVKPGKGNAFVRTKLKNIRTGLTLEKTFRAGEKVKSAYIENKPMQLLYTSDDEAVFMDMNTFDQINIGIDKMGDGMKWLKEGSEINVQIYEGEIVGVDIPNFVELKVEFTEPGHKGDTATGGTKPATLETGAVIQVPLFVDMGEKLQIDTRTGTYLKRV